ncbi:MAG: hypothetical protein M0R17_00785 [Candidatus Omnitrophica bacterium]|jgi:hypothetical protein|nr:hypothetical protein [Candidatus Omnitrophota bacterium]
MKIAFNGYLYEARNIPTEDELREKYGSLGDSYFFSYRSINKIGLNPQSQWNTPNGVYTYNFKDLGNRESPYKGTSTNGYIYVIKLKPNINGIDSRTYNTIDLEQDLNKLKQFGYEIDLEKYYRMNNPFKAIWTATYDVKKSPNDWTKILLALGYYYVRDRGEGVIHTNEPYQTVFLSPKAYDIVDSGTYGNVAIFNGTIDQKWIKKYAASLTEKNVKPVAKSIYKYFTQHNNLPRFDIFNATNTNILTDIYKTAFKLIGTYSINQIFQENPKMLVALGISSDFAKELINQYKSAFTNSTRAEWLKALNDEDRLEYVDKFIDTFKKITEVDTYWIAYLQIKDRIPMIIKLAKEINSSIINTPDNLNVLIYDIRPISKEDQLKLFDILIPSIKEITNDGNVQWLNNLLYQYPELQAQKLTTTLHDEVAKLITNNEMFFLSYFTIEDNKHMKAFEMIMHTFSKYINRSIKEYPENIFWKHYPTPFKQVFEPKELN